MGDGRKFNCIKNTNIALINKKPIPMLSKALGITAAQRVLSVNLVVILLAIVSGMTSCNMGNQNQKDVIMRLSEKTAGQFEGQDVKEYTLTNIKGMQAKLINYGAIVTSLTAADRDGKFENVVLGFADAEQYWTEPYKSNCCYLGAIVGRYGNRIAQGKFSVDDQEYTMAINNGPNHLHGGIKGFDKVVWVSKGFENETGSGVEFSYRSVDGEEGYPGNFDIKVIYTLTDQNELKIEYQGSVDQICPINITHHGYFNLTGEAKRDVLDHQVVINAKRYTVVDETLIPTGELRAVEGTPMDFNQAHTIGERIAQVDGGYDHNYVLSDEVTALKKVVQVVEPVSGRVMVVMTTEPGIQFYSGNFLDGILKGSGDRTYNQHWGFCLETQHFPDSPNQATFPSTLLKPGEKYSHQTVYRFMAR